MYRPSIRINKNTPLTVNEIDPKQAQEQIKLKQIIKGDANLPKFKGKGIYDKIDELLKYSDPEQVRKNANKYFKKYIPIYISDKKDTKYMLQNPEGKWINFGQMFPPMEDYTKHKDEKRRERYLKRTANMRGNWKNDKYSANNLSRNLLW